MAYRQEVFKGSGYLMFGDRFVGNVENLSLGITTSNQAIKNYITGIGNVIDINKVENSELSATLLDSSIENLKIGIFGTTTSLAATPFTAVVVAGLKDRRLRLDRLATFTTIEVEKTGVYSAGVEGVDYDKNIAGIFPKADANYKVSGSYVASDVIESLIANFPETRVVAVLTSEFQPGIITEVVFHKVSFSPLASLNLIGDSATKIELKGTVLADASQLAEKSQYFTVTRTKVA